MNEIGGYFELELPTGYNYYHKAPTFLNLGRNSLLMIAKANDYRKNYIPQYISDSSFSSLIKNDIEVTFYKINKDFEPNQKITLKKK